MAVPAILIALIATVPVVTLGQALHNLRLPDKLCHLLLFTTVLEDVAFGPLNQGKPPAEAIRIARETMGRLGLEGFPERVTYKLSGGEKKLVALATVLAMQPQLLLLDEPTTGLDENTRRRLIRILQDLDIAYLIVSHEPDFLEHTVAECCQVQATCCKSSK